MAAPEIKRVKRMTFELNSNIVAEATDVTITYRSGASQGHGYDGANYFSLGNHITGIEFSTIKPQGGETVDTVQAMLNDEIVSASWIEAGSVRYTSGIIMEASTRSNSENGMLTGQYQMSAGKAQNA